jgi:hypothetical protein
VGYPCLARSKVDRNDDDLAELLRQLENLELTSPDEYARLAERFARDDMAGFEQWRRPLEWLELRDEDMRVNGDRCNIDRLDGDAIYHVRGQSFKRPRCTSTRQGDSSLTEYLCDCGRSMTLHETALRLKVSCAGCGATKTFQPGQYKFLDVEGSRCLSVPGWRELYVVASRRAAA